MLARQAGDRSVGAARPRLAPRRSAGGPSSGGGVAPVVSFGPPGDATLPVPSVQLPADTRASRHRTENSVSVGHGAPDLRVDVSLLDSDAPSDAPGERQGILTGGGWCHAGLRSRPRRLAGRVPARWASRRRGNGRELQQDWGTPSSKRATSRWQEWYSPPPPGSEGRSSPAHSRWLFQICFNARSWERKPGFRARAAGRRT
jgi:hypothetical protein